MLLINIAETSNAEKIDCGVSYMSFIKDEMAGVAYMAYTYWLK